MSRAIRHRALSALLARARRRLAQLGHEPADGYFVCPTCLRLLPEALASRGHFPADALPGGSAQTELQCTECNHVVSRYEAAAINFFTRDWDLELGVPGQPGRVRAKGRVTTDGQGVQIDLSRFSPKARRDLASLRARSAAPGRLDFTITEPTPESALRPLLAWSFLAWFYYGGYRYAASAGAALVRRAILDPEQPLPHPIIYSRGNIDRPLPKPEPVLLITAKDGRPPSGLSDVANFLGVGASWGATTVVMPFANDAAGRVWNALKALDESGELGWIGLWPLRKMLSIPLIEKGLDAPMVIENKATTERWAITESLSEDQVRKLVEGRSEHVIAPPAGPLRRREPPRLQK